MDMSAQGAHLTPSLGSAIDQARSAVAPMPRPRHGDLDLVVEHDEAEAVGGIEAVDERLDGALGRLEAIAGHRAAAVEHDLERGGRAGSL